MSDVRWATNDDIPELVRLREVLSERMAEDLGPPPAGYNGWREVFAATVAERLADGSMAVFVVDGDDRLAACGVGLIDGRLPGPYSASGLRGYLLGMATDPAYRRRGYADAIVAALLDWYRERGITRVELHATSDGESLYRRHGFTDGIEPALDWRM
jgi:GNAT superfamily N-acetyltransferase